MLENKIKEYWCVFFFNEILIEKIILTFYVLIILMTHLISFHINFYSMFFLSPWTYNPENIGHSHQLQRNTVLIDRIINWY